MSRTLQSAVRSVLVFAFAAPCFALDASSYYSPMNRSRAVRPETRYIILHTTEGPTRGSLDKVHRLGETHFFVDPRGHVHRIIDRRKIATHAGRSMWNGTRNIDNCSIGVEVVGYHDRGISGAQVLALRELLTDLQDIYGIPDRNVLCHAMVAYGTPNRWHSRSHRGRKRCGMLFATEVVRERIGLYDKPLFDPDVRAGRLVVGDAYLQGVLYPKIKSPHLSAEEPRGSIARPAQTDLRGSAAASHTASPVTGPGPAGTRAPGGGTATARKPDAVSPPDDQQGGPEGLLATGPGHESAASVAGSEYDSVTTTYFLPDGRVRRGNQLPPSTLERLPPGTRILVGYVCGGSVTSRRSAFDICGPKWNYPSTFYRLPDGKVVSGDTLKENSIPRQALIFFRH